MPNARVRAALLAATDGVTLVRRAIAEHHAFKDAFLELETRAPDDAATDVVVEAYRAGQTPPWLAAALLGAARGDHGYDVAHEILRLGARLLSESYAGVAMARIRGPRAVPDLVAAMHDDALGRHSREGAAYGLGHLHLEGTLEAIAEAVRRHRLTISCAGSVITRFADIEPQVVAWLSSENERLKDVAFAAAVHLSAQDGGRLSLPLADAVERALEGRIDLSNHRIRILRERIARARTSS